MPSGPWGRLKPVDQDPLESMGLPSKGDLRYLLHLPSLIPLSPLGCFPSSLLEPGRPVPSAANDLLV